MRTERGACAWRVAPLHPRPLASSYEGGAVAGYGGCGGAAGSKDGWEGG